MLFALASSLPHAVKHPRAAAHPREKKSVRGLEGRRRHGLGAGQEVCRGGCGVLFLTQMSAFACFPCRPSPTRASPGETKQTAVALAWFMQRLQDMGPRALSRRTGHLQVKPQEGPRLLVTTISKITNELSSHSYRQGVGGLGHIYIYL